MGMKKRDFTGQIKSAIQASIDEKGALTRREILEEIRGQRKLRPSVRRIGLAISRLVKSGKIEQVGSRGGARFRSAR